MMTFKNAATENKDLARAYILVSVALRNGVVEHGRIVRFDESFHRRDVSCQFFKSNFFPLSFNLLVLSQTGTK
jgi:hypothetical protein